MIVIKEFDKQTHELVKELELSSFSELIEYPDSNMLDYTIESDLWDTYKKYFDTSVDTEEAFNKAIMNIVWYLDDEFDIEHHDYVLKRLNSIGLAYTTGLPDRTSEFGYDYGRFFGKDEEYDFQLEVNLIEHTIHVFYAMREVYTKKYHSLEEMNDEFLEQLNFDDLISEYLDNDNFIGVLIEKIREEIVDELAYQLMCFIKEVNYYDWLDEAKLDSPEKELDDLKSQLNDKESLESIYENIITYQDEVLEEDSTILDDIIANFHLLDEKLEDKGMSM